MKRRSFIFYVAILCLAMLLCQIFVVTSNKMRLNKLRENHIVINGGRISKIVPVHKSTIRYIEYGYTFDGKGYFGKSSYGNGFNKSMSDLDFNIIYERRIPVIVDRENPSNSTMLLHPSEYSSFGIPFPDSLSWLKPLLENIKSD